MRSIFLIKLSNIIIENYQIIQYCSKINDRISKGWLLLAEGIRNLKGMLPAKLPYFLSLKMNMPC